MPFSPPPEELLDQPEMPPMELFGRMRSLIDSARFSGVLPALWQCSDESQGIKKALYGYVFDCPVFNLGRVGALLDPTRLVPASHHGKDLVILGGSHLGARETEGIGHVERIHGHVAPCCGMMFRVLRDYLESYRRAASLIRVGREGGRLLVEVPYQYLFRTPPSGRVQLRLRLRRLVEGEVLRESNHGKVYALDSAFALRHQGVLSGRGEGLASLGEMLSADLFHFVKRLAAEPADPADLLEASLFDFLPGIVCSKRPHRRMADVNTWRQFHRLAGYLAEAFDGEDRNVLVVAGLTVDHSIRSNAIVPQFGFLLTAGRSLEADYFGAPEVNELLGRQEIFRPEKSFLEYAGVTS